METVAKFSACPAARRWPVPPCACYIFSRPTFPQGRSTIDHQPLYLSANLHRAYQLRYGSDWLDFPHAVPNRSYRPRITGHRPEWEKDGIRVLESSLAAQQIQLTLSTTPHVDPITLIGQRHFSNWVR